MIFTRCFPKGIFEFLVKFTPQYGTATLWIAVDVFPHFLIKLLIINIIK